jgi:hypothetical protein
MSRAVPAENSLSPLEKFLLVLCPLHYKLYSTVYNEKSKGSRNVTAIAAPCWIHVELCTHLKKSEVASMRSISEGKHEVAGDARGLKFDWELVKFGLGVIALLVFVYGVHVLIHIW